MKLKHAFHTLVLACLLSTTTSYGQSGDTAVPFGTKLITDALSHPTAFAEPKDRSGRLFVCEQEGRILIVKDGKLLPEPFLDVTGEIIKRPGYEERGLLGLAFHPDFARNGKFYIYCSVAVTPRVPGVNHKCVIKEYTVSRTNKSQADKSTSRVVLEYNHPDGNHNGGDIKFGPDGFLYIASGDGGGQNDQHGDFGNGQNLGTLLGKILRIDINQKPYGIPKTNPFVDKKGARPEIYAYGFRNPWRISFDRVKGTLFVADVGQDNYEEVNIVTRGGNYGWRVREGLHSKFKDDPDPKNWIDPIVEYPHTEGLSVTGGYVYRGKQIPALTGKYVFADWLGTVWTLSPVRSQWRRQKATISRNAGYWHIYSFGEDQSGELYLLTMLLGGDKGALFKLVK